MKRTETLQVHVKDLAIGGNNHVVIQSMCNIKTEKADEVITQIRQLESLGCELIRVSCMDMNDAKAIKTIVQNIHIPLVADIHFDYKLALACIEAGANKIRLNPGNIGKKENVEKVVEACKKYHVPIRIGINGGSLEKDIHEKYGKPTAQGMVESAMRHVKILEEHDFYNTVLSFKSSDPLLCIEAYRLASETFPYPLHLGVTEAGTKEMGIVKSSIGIGALLNQGIGDTIRVSLTDDPVEEIYAANNILKALDLKPDEPYLISCPTCGRTQIDLISLAKEVEKRLKNVHKPIKVAVMGCIVNGPGEAKEADIGIAGGNGEGLIFKKGKILMKLPEDKLVDKLFEEIEAL